MADFLIASYRDDVVFGRTTADRVTGYPGGTDRIDLRSGDDHADLTQIVWYDIYSYYDEDYGMYFDYTEFSHMGPRFTGVLEGGSGSDTLEVSLEANPGWETTIGYAFSLRGTKLSGFEHLILNCDVEISIAQLKSFQTLAHEPGRSLGFELFGAGGTFALPRVLGSYYSLFVSGRNLTSALEFGGTKARDIVDDSPVDDVIKGGDGDDIIRHSKGADTLVGGKGRDIFEFEWNSTSTLMLDRVAAGQPLPDGTVISEFETILVFGGAAGNTIVGSARREYIDGGSGNDTLRGGAGYDTLSGDQGDDVLYGDGGLDYIYGDEGDDLAFGGEGNDKLAGYDGNDRLYGGYGNDKLTGDAGNDRLDGERGADTMRGIGGDDTFVVDNTGDIVEERANEGNDTLETSISYVLPENCERLSLTGTADINGWGNAAANSISGNTGDNILTGLRGADVLTGRGGADTFRYVSLADSRQADGIDRISDFSFAAGDRIDVSAIDANAVLAGNQAFTTLIAAGDAFAQAGQYRFTQQGASYLAEFNSDGDAQAELAVLLQGAQKPAANWFVL